MVETNKILKEVAETVKIKNKADYTLDDDNDVNT